jgi:RNA polymerase sigma-70 factor (ECF subfamily)
MLQTLPHRRAQMAIIDHGETAARWRPYCFRSRNPGSLLGKKLPERNAVMRQNPPSMSALGYATGSRDHQSTTSFCSAVPYDDREAVDDTVYGDAAETTRAAIPPDHPAQPESDQQLIDAVLAGDPAQFNGLVMRYANRLYRFILKNIGHAALAEDLAQETFVEAFRQLPTFRGEAKFSTWLFGIALNKIRNYINRSPDGRQQHSPMRIPRSNPASDGNPTQLLEKKQTLLALQQAIETLPTELRESLILVAMEELPYEEAAQLLGIPVGTLKSRVHRARDLLRQSMRLDVDG